DAVLVGSYQVVGAEMRVDARLLSILTGEVLATARAQGDARDVEGVGQKAAKALLAGLGLEDQKERRPFFKQRWFWVAAGAVALGAAAVTVYEVGFCHSDFCVNVGP